MDNRMFLGRRTYYLFSLD